VVVAAVDATAMDISMTTVTIIIKIQQLHGLKKWDYGWANRWKY
jgi:hypothetical protein